MIFDEQWRKRIRRDKLARSYDKGIKKVEKARDFRGAESMREEAAHFVSEADDELAFINSQKLIARARRLPIPLPDYSDKESWDQSWYGHVLTTKGQAELLRNIRQEESERLKHGMRLWREVLIPIGTFIAGVVATYFAMKGH